MWLVFGLLLQEQTIFKFKKIPDICHPLKGFFVLLPFCPNVRHFCRHNQRGDNEHSMMQMKWCLKPEADAGAAG